MVGIVDLDMVATDFGVDLFSAGVAALNLGVAALDLGIAALDLGLALSSSLKSSMLLSSS